MPVTKRHLLNDFIYMSYPNWGGSAQGQASFYLISSEFQFYKMKKFWVSV